MYVLLIRKVKADFSPFFIDFLKEIVVHYLHNNTSTSHYVCTYRSGTFNSNTVNSKFHLIRSFFEIFARFLSFHV